MCSNRTNVLNLTYSALKYEQNLIKSCAPESSCVSLPHKRDGSSSLKLVFSVHATKNGQSVQNIILLQILLMLQSFWPLLAKCTTRPALRKSWLSEKRQKEFYP